MTAADKESLGFNVYSQHLMQQSCLLVNFLQLDTKLIITWQADCAYHRNRTLTRRLENPKLK